MLRTGQVVDGGWRVITPLPAGEELLRWFGRELESGRVVEILRPKSVVPLRRRRAIVAGFRAALGDPAVVPILHVSARGVMIRELPGERTLADLAGPLPPRLAPGLAGWLGPAVLAMSPVLAGRLEKQELVLGVGGRPLLAPGGRRPEDPTGLERSPLGMLGALLYELIAGCKPADPPRPLRSYVPETPADIEAMVLDLMSPDPVVARRALPDRPAEAPLLEPDDDLADSGSAGAAPPLSASRPPYTVVVEAGGLGAVGRRRFSEAMGLPDDLLDSFVEAGLPLPIASARSREGAAIWVEELSAFRVDASVVAFGKRFEPAWLLQASPLALGSAVAAAAGLWPLAAVSLAGAAGLVGWRVQQEASRRRAVERAYEKLESYEGSPSDAPNSNLVSSRPSAFSHELSSAISAVGGREQIRSALRSALSSRPGASSSPRGG